MMNLVQLPPKALAKYTGNLMASAAEIDTVARAATMRASELDHRMAFAAPPPDERNRNPNAMSAEAIQLKTEIEEQRARAAVHHAKSAAIKQLLTNIENWRRDFKPGFKLVDAKPVELPKLTENSFQQAVGEIRVQIGELDKERRHLASATPTKAEQHEAARRYVDDLARKAKPTIRATHGKKLELTFGHAHSLLNSANVTAAIMAWVSPEQYLARIIEALDAQPVGYVMSAEEVAKKTEFLRSETLRLERIEEATITLASRHDMEITRRPTASPLAVLEVEMVRIEATTAA